MKKLINRIEDVVREATEGLVAAHADVLRWSPDPLFVYRADAPRSGKVAVISGGGSGHEPLHSGYVGVGMLDAACPGEVFTSPVPDQMVVAAKTVDGGAGVLFIVKNYTGDVMNFELAEEMLRDEGLSVRSVLVADDVAVEHSTYTVGRRGVGGTVFVEKIAGAAAEDGATLEEVARLAQKASERVRSMGLALSSCTVPARGVPTFELADDEIELGIGIHGEPGRERIQREMADALTDRLLQPILEELALRSGDRVIAMVNGMGGTPIMELYIVYRRLHARLSALGVSIDRRLVGNYITSLEMQGVSLTLLKADDELLHLWDRPVRTPALRWGDGQ